MAPHEDAAGWWGLCDFAVPQIQSPPTPRQRLSCARRAAGRRRLKGPALGFAGITLWLARGEGDFVLSGMTVSQLPYPTWGLSVGRQKTSDLPKVTQPLRASAGCQTAGLEPFPSSPAAGCKCGVLEVIPRFLVWGPALSTTWARNQATATGGGAGR